MKQLEEYFYDGQFQTCYELAKAQKSELTEHYIHLFERYQYDALPKPTNYSVAQSIEHADETYEEYAQLHKIRALKNEEQFQNEVKQLEHIAKTGTDEEKAASFFTQGHLFLMAHHYDESVHCFIEAAKANPNKAVYFGYAAQTMHRLNWSPFETMGFLNEALALDGNNARWYWCKALVLIQLYKDLEQEAFLGNAIIALETAQLKCRPEQKSLATAIETTFEGVREYIFE